MKNLILPCVIAVMVYGITPSVAAQTIAVIVNKSSSVSNLSMAELKTYFKLESQFWKNNERVAAATLAYEKPEATKFNSLVYEMPNDGVKKTWIQKIFRGQIKEAPKLQRSDEDMLKFVAATSGAIGFISADKVDGSVKVVTIDGNSPKDSGYKLK